MSTIIFAFSQFSVDLSQQYYYNNNIRGDSRMNDKTATFADRLQELMVHKNLTKTALAKLCGIDKSNITRYCRGDYEAKQDVVYRIAFSLNVDEAWLMGYDVPMQKRPARPEASNIIKLPEMHRYPLLGAIACGDPILATENIDDYVYGPDGIHADYALRCKGDSMINARIYDGDIVYIRQQTTVDDGDIAAVLIDNDEATLKRFRQYEDHVVLEPENPQYRPLVFWGADMQEVRIIGKAVAFTSVVR